MNSLKFSQDRSVIIMGQQGWGKSTLGNSLIRELSKHIPIIVFNTEGGKQFVQDKNVAVYNPDLEGRKDLLKLFNKFIVLLRAKFSNFGIYIVDLEKFFLEKSVISFETSELKDLYVSGRHQRILKIVESKQPRFIPQTIIANSNLLFIGYLLQNDRKVLSDYVSREELRALKKYEFVCVDMWTGERCVVNSKFEFVKSLKSLNEL
ncbi:MAG: ATP-binding protein [Candidatus Micrarchaeaceae archaeon]